MIKKCVDFMEKRIWPAAYDRGMVAKAIYRNAIKSKKTDVLRSYEK